ncbi:MAG: double-strand break repair protein AddB, partial [Pseudolabrys sp.]|nr:double-strand break repair protein AddB [Pseudolabrys sp.]
MPAAPRVFNIPASAPFLPTLIAALLRGELVGGYPPKDDPLALAKATLYLPTRRACQLARAQFLAAMGGDAAVLPRIVPLGHIDEEDIDFVPAGADAVAGALPNSLSPFQRTMALAGLILDWSRKEGMQALGGTPLVASTPAAAFRLANDLGRLMDDMATRQVSWDRLDDLVPTDFDEYWVKTLGFLKIARETWPRYLAEQGLVEPAERQNLLIAAEAERLARSGDPVIAAGSTGSIPATAALLETIAHLPRGAVVLPGLDLLLDDTAWQAIGDADSAPSHPQYAMHGLLRRIGIARGAVKSLGDSQRREVLVSETMRPAALTDVWSAQHHDKVMQAEIAGGMDNIAVIEAANAEEEALAIAISLREAMETPRSSAALVTPDRALARRVKAALARWNIEADDSAADRLADTAAGIFAQLAAEATLGGLQPVPLLALLKHPLCKRDAAAVAALERAILRGPRPRAGTAGLARALERFRANRGSLHPSDPRANVTGAELEAAQALARELAASLAPLEAIKPGEQTFAAIARAHRDAVKNLAGELPSLAAVFDDIIENGTLRVTVNDYAELFHAALASTA